MPEYIHRTKYELQDDTAANANSARLLNGIALAMLLIVASGLVFATVYTPQRTAQDMILNDFAQINLATAEKRPPMHSASLPPASHFE